MKRIIYLTVAIVAAAFCSQAWLGTEAPAQAATVTDTFALKLTFKEWCQGNPKFFENINVKVADNYTLTLIRDVLNTGDLSDIQATINNTGNADINAMTLNGLAFPRSTPGSKAELVLSGVNPGNDDHFFTIRGQAKFDTLGNLTKVTGTFVFQITDVYTLAGGGTSGPRECFANGTFETKNKLTPP